MKKFKILSMILAFLLLFSFTACNNESDSNLSVFKDKETHHIEGTLHDFNVTENSNRQFVVNGKSDYKIIAESKNSYVVTAVNFIVKHVANKTGFTLPVVYYTDDMAEDFSSNDKAIIINCSTLFDKVGLTMPSYDELGVSGYYIKTVDNAVFIMNLGVHGYQLGAYKFLEEVLGYDMLGEDMYVYEKNGTSIPNMEIKERPDVDYRASSATATADSYYGMGYNLQTYADLFMGVPDRSTGTGAIPVHNSYNYLPPSMYYAEHPSWFYQPGVVQAEQLCYSAHGAYATAEQDKINGNPNEYNAMVETLAEYLIEIVDNNPTLNNITITHQDNGGSCGCDFCTSKVQEYGTISVVYLNFLNDVDDILQEHLENQAIESGEEKREVNILFFAYYATKYAPNKVDDYSTCNEHVGLIIAPIQSFYTSSFYEDINLTEGEASMIKDWTKHSKKILYWLYETSFGDPSAYFYPYNSWDDTVETYRFVVEHDAIWVWNEGQNGQRTPSAFMALKNYTDAKALVNCNVNYKELEQKFFKYYYGAGGDAMYKVFKEMQTRMDWIEANYSVVSGHLHRSLNVEAYWPFALLLTWEGYINSAYEAVEADYKITGDKKAYDLAKKKIMIDSLCPRYILIDLYSANFSTTEKYNRMMAFKTDNLSINNKRLNEGSTLDALYLSWGI